LTHLSVLAVVLPLLCAFLMPLLDMVSNRVNRAAVVLFATGQIVVLLLLIPQVAADGTVEYHLGGWGPRIGIVLVVDGFSLLFALLVAVGIWMVSLFSLDYVDRREYRYFVLLFIVLAGVTGMVLTGDLFNLYVFFELASLASFPLIAFAKNPGAVEAAFRYMLYSTIASVFILLAIGLTYGATGTLNLRQAAEVLSSADATVRSAVLGLLLVGFAIKVAIVPFHAWLPEAHGSAPAPVSALLSGVLLKTGVYAMVRLLLTFGPGVGLGRLEHILLNLGALSVIVGHSLAVGQTNVKKMLAFSSIAHIGIIVTGVGLGTVYGLAGALFHAINHLFMKATAFFAAGRFGAGRGFEMADLRGAGWQAPWAAAAFIVSALSLIGLPPLAGFIGKWEITLDALRHGHLFHAAAILLGTLLSAVYYGRVTRILFSKTGQNGPPEKSGGLFAGLALCAGVAGCFVQFLVWGRIEPILIHIAGLIRG
jgi:multicomponent Na+:H+ antiporter subunit D